MATRTISTKISLDGEKEFKTQMSSVNSQLKTLNSEMKLVDAEFKGQANSMEALTAKNKVLSEQYAQQSEKVKALEQAVKDASEAYGEDSKQVDQYKQQLNNAKASLLNLDDELKKNESYLKEAEESTDGCARSIDEYGKEVKDASTETNTFGAVLKANLTSEAIIAGVKALAGAVKEVGKAFGESISQTAQYGDEIDKQSQKLQISAESYQELSFAAERCGTSIETIGTAQKTLASKDFDGDIKDAILAVASLTDADERAAKATELFGKKAGQELLPLLNSGADGIQGLFDEVNALGGVMSQDAVNAAATYQDSLTNLQTAFGGLKNNLAGEFLPSVTTIMDGVTAVITGDVDAGVAMIEEGIEQFGEQLQQLGPYAEEALNLLTQVIVDSLPDIVECGGNVLISLIDGLLEQMPQLIPAVVDIVTSIVETLTSNIDLLIDAALKLMVGLATGLIKAIPQLVSKLPEIISAIVNGLIDAVPKIADAGRELIKGLWQGISDMGAWIGEKIRGFGEGIVNSLKSFFGIHSPSTLMRDQIGKYLAEGVTEGFTENIDAEAMADAIPSNFDIATNVNSNLKNPTVNTLTAEQYQSALGQATNALISAQQSGGGDLTIPLVINGREVARATIADYRYISKSTPEVALA